MVKDDVRTNVKLNQQTHRKKL